MTDNPQITFKGSIVIQKILLPIKGVGIKVFLYIYQIF